MHGELQSVAPTQTSSSIFPPLHLELWITQDSDEDKWWYGHYLFSSGFFGFWVLKKRISQNPVLQGFLK
jgi:hypothetical protein